MSTGLDLSGSPLVNLRGEVIGVNTYIPDQSDQANTKVGYAIPANILQRLVPELIRRGVYEWPWLGLNGVSVSLENTEANNLKTQRGVYITKVLTDGPAAKAGLSGSQGITGGDIIIAADSDPINEYVDLLNHIAFKDPGDKVLLTIIRDGQIKDITVILEPRPEDAGTGST